MARQVNGQLKGAQGKVGDVTYYTMNGQTYARKANTDQVNPQTENQMSRRVKLANVVAMYRAGAQWQKRSFQSKLRTQSDYNKFVQQNLNTSSVTLTKSQVELGACVVAPYMVTRGTIPSIHLTPTPAGVYTSLNVGNSSLSVSSRVSDWTQTLVANNPTVQMGDQISVIVYEQKINVDTNIPYVICRSYEVTLDPLNTEPMFAYIPGTYWSVSQQGTQKVVGTSGVLPIGGIAYVLSRNTRRGLEVSTQYIAMTNSSVLQQYTSPEQLREAMLSYGLNPDAFLNPDSTEESGETPSSLECLALGLGIPSQARNYVTLPVSYWLPNEQRCNLVFLDGPTIGVKFNQSVSFSTLRVDLYDGTVVQSTSFLSDSQNPDNAEKVYYATMPNSIASSSSYIRRLVFTGSGSTSYVIEGFPSGDTD